MNRENYSAQVNGKDYAKAAIRNMYTAPAFVQVNGKDFGDVVADKLQTYGDQWERCESCRRSKTDSIARKKQKLSLKKQKLNSQKDGVQFPIHLGYIS